MCKLTRHWFVVVLGFLISSSALVAAPSELKGKYQKPVIDKSLFAQGLAMLGTERDDYATNLAAYAVRIIRDSNGSQESLDLARRLLGLGLHLSPRNKKSVIANAQLARGVMPGLVAGDYEPDVFARLLLARGQLLEKGKGDKNLFVARYLIDLAAIIDPRNEDAIYESEIRRIDQGSVSWAKLTGEKVVKPDQPAVKVENK